MDSEKKSDIIKRLRKAKFKPPKKLPPMTLEIVLPTLSDFSDREIKQSKINRLLKILKKASNDEFRFIFNSRSDFVRIIPD